MKNFKMLLNASKSQYKKLDKPNIELNNMINYIIRRFTSQGIFAYYFNLRVLKVTFRAFQGFQGPLSSM